MDIEKFIEDEVRKLQESQREVRMKNDKMVRMGYAIIGLVVIDVFLNILVLF